MLKNSIVFGIWCTFRYQNKLFSILLNYWSRGREFEAQLGQYTTMSKSI